MKKDQTELIIVKVLSDGQEALNAKIYKDGTTCRRGVGALPELGISGMSFFHDAGFFNQLFDQLPENVVENPVNYEEATPNGYLEYIVAFYGASANGQTGEQAQWTQSSGLRVKLDHQTKFKDPVLAFLDFFAVETVRITNEWYFDIFMKAKYNALSSKLPEETFISLPNTESAINIDFENYINQMTAGPGKRQLTDFGKDTVYMIEGRRHNLFINPDVNLCSIRFFEAMDMPHSPSPVQPKSNKWWKFW